MTRTSIAISCFKAMHMKYIGFPYAVSYGKDSRLLKDLVSVYKLETLVEMMEKFFERVRKDEFLKKAGVSIGVFRSQIPKLVLEVKNDQPKGVLDTESLANH